MNVHFKPLELTVWPMAVDLRLRSALFWYLRPNLRPLGFLLMSLKFDVGYPTFKFLALGSILGLWESILGIWEVIFGPWAV